jgi:hypothetical protein
MRVQDRTRVSVYTKQTKKEERKKDRERERGGVNVRK